MALASGTKLGPYEIIAPLGAGGMGEVYRARDTKLGRDVAVKLLPSSFSGDSERLRRFEQEACAAGALNHPNVLVIHHIETHEGAPYIVSELLEGETLRKRMSGTAMAQRRVIDYASQIVHGLAAAHEKGIVHRDLKPDNIFITKDGRVKILDFGIAKLTQPEGNQSQTEIPTRRVNTDPGVVIGTVGYMSPEQVRGKGVDHCSDIFSFGAILYEMLSGHRAFQGESAADTMSAILSALLLLALIAALPFVFLYFRSAPASRPNAVRATIAAPENAHLLSFNNMAVSPDGLRLAFVAIGANGMQSLWLRPLGASSA